MKIIRKSFWKIDNYFGAIPVFCGLDTPRCGFNRIRQHSHPSFAGLTGEWRNGAEPANGAWEERPDALRQEIFDLLFEAAEIATFTPEDKVKYEFEMTTERDIRNQIAFAKKNARAEGKIEGIEEGKMEEKKETVRRLKEMGIAANIIALGTELTEEQVQAI